jgi:hypothetical protein
MGRPLRTKACTFPSCGGRMFLRFGAVVPREVVGQPVLSESIERTGTWECHVDQRHVEDAKREDV